MRVLVDSNIWRYIIDGGALPAVRNAARRSNHTMAVAPAVLYEAAHTGHIGLRNSLLSAMALPMWKRLMPEAYHEAEEIKGEVQRLRPEWLRLRPDLARFNRIRHDWARSRGGVWERIRSEAELLSRHDADMHERAQEQAYAQREETKSWTPKWETVPLSKTMASLPSPIAGWNGGPVEPWRVDGLRKVCKTGPQFA